MELKISKLERGIDYKIQTYNRINLITKIIYNIRLSQQIKCRYWSSGLCGIVGRHQCFFESYDFLLQG